MNKKLKEKILNSLVITEATKTFVQSLDPGFGSIIKNSKYGADSEEPEYQGWARLDDGTVIVITGNSKEQQGKSPTLPIRVVEVPKEMIGEKEEYTANVPSYKSKDFL